MVSNRPPTSISLVTLVIQWITCAKLTKYNWSNCHLHIPQFCANLLARSRYLSFLSHSFSFIPWSAGTAKSPILQVTVLLRDYLFSLVSLIWLGHLLCIIISPIIIIMRVIILGQVLELVHIPFDSWWSNLNFLHIDQWMTLPTQSSLVL